MRQRQILLAGLALAAVTIAAYAGIGNLGFVPLDDPGYVYENPHVTAGLTWDGVRWAFSTGFLANWHPLTWMSHMADISLFALDPGKHHLTSLVFHVANALLLFAAFVRMTGAIGRSAFVAALFAVHPLHVESVAWISERKDVLSTFFWLLTMWTYVSYSQHGGALRYMGALACFALGLMAKPMLVTLPLILLLLDRWPLERGATLQDALLEKIPFAAIAIASSVVTFMVQRAGGAVTTAVELPIFLRLENAIVSSMTYVAQMLLPIAFGVFYPYPSRFEAWEIVGALSGLVFLTWLAGRFVLSRPYLLVGWLWFVITLIPVIGLVQVGSQAMADRYTYVPLIGLFVMIAWGVPDLLSRWPARRVALPAAATAVVLALTALTRAQVDTWKDGWSMWNHDLAVTKDNARAENAVGAMIGEQGRTAEAEPYFREALRVEPNMPEANRNLGVALAAQGKISEAVPLFQTAIQYKPDFVDAHRDLGDALFALKRNAEALHAYGEAVRLQPDSAEGHMKYGFALAADSQVAAAIVELREAVRLKPDSEAAHLYLGMALGAAGQLAEARDQFTLVLRINPANEAAKNGLARAAK